MKIYVKSSFGYRDSDWVDPDDSMWEHEGFSCSANCSFEILTDASGTPDDDSINSAIESMQFDSEFIDPEYGFDVCDADDVAVEVATYVQNKYEGKLDANSKYLVSCDATVPYEYDVMYPPKNYTVDNEYVDKESRINPDSVEYGPIEFKCSVKKLA